MSTNGLSSIHPTERPTKEQARPRRERQETRMTGAAYTRREIQVVEMKDERHLDAVRTDPRCLNFMKSSVQTMAVQKGAYIASIGSA